MSARSIAHALFRHKRLFVSVLAACLMAGAVAAAAWRPQYRAEATLVAEAGNPRALAALARSRDVAAAIVARLGPALFPDIAAPDRADALLAALSAESDDAAALVRVRLDAAMPDLAAQALAAVIAEIRLRGGVLVPTGDGDTAPRRVRLAAELAAARSRAEALDKALASLTKQLAATPATIRLTAQRGRSQVVDQARAKVFDLQTKEQELLGTYRDGSVLVERARAERKRAQELLADLLKDEDTRVVEGINPVHQELQGRVIDTQASLTEAQVRAGALSSELAQLDEASAQLDGAPQDGVGVLQGAVAAPRPVGPGPGQLAAAAAGLGLVLACAAVALAQRLSTRFSTPAEVEKTLGLAVLATIPRES